MGYSGRQGHDPHSEQPGLSLRRACGAAPYDSGTRRPPAEVVSQSTFRRPGDLILSVLSFFLAFALHCCELRALVFRTACEYGDSADVQGRAKVTEPRRRLCACEHCQRPRL